MKINIFSVFLRTFSAMKINIFSVFLRKFSAMKVNIFSVIFTQFSRYITLHALFMTTTHDKTIYWKHFRDNTSKFSNFTFFSRPKTFTVKTSNLREHSLHFSRCLSKKYSLKTLHIHFSVIYFLVVWNTGNAYFLRFNYITYIVFFLWEHKHRLTRKNKIRKKLHFLQYYHR
jgi:hypothetical protein